MPGLRDFLKPKNILLLILVIGVIALLFYFLPKQIEKPPYVYGYRLVNEKISQSASISINLPSAVDKLVAQENVEFSPDIKGEWLSSDDEKIIVFKPEEDLKLNRYYSVQLSIAQSEERTIKADFLAVENPEIIAVFPKDKSETHEKSEITIVFNRPMVPLTTLSYLEEQDVPVEIVPETKGRFKWITTRNLQFIPEERLIRSSNYKVRIKSGWLQ